MLIDNLITKGLLGFPQLPSHFPVNKQLGIPLGSTVIAPGGITDSTVRSTQRYINTNEEESNQFIETCCPIQTMAIDHLYNTSSLMVTISGVLISGIASWILYDVQELEEATEDIKDNLKVEIVTDSFQDYYSIFNKKGGWLNLSFLMLGLGLTQIVLPLFACLGVHRKTSFLLITFISFLLITIMLQIGAVILINWRNFELKQFYYLSTSRASISRFHLTDKKICLVISLMWSAVTLVTSVSALILRQTHSRKEKHLTAMDLVI